MPPRLAKADGDGWVSTTVGATWAGAMPARCRTGVKCLGRETLLASQHTHEELVAGAHMRREAKKALVPEVDSVKTRQTGHVRGVPTGASPPVRT